MPPTDPIAAVTHADPYPYYAALARERPLYRDDTLNLWVASSPQAIAQVLAHPAARVRPPAEPVPRGLCPGPAGALFGRFVRMNDSAEHARLKTLLRAYIDSQPAPDLNGAWPLPRIDAAGVDRYLTLAPVYAQAAFMGLPPDVHGTCAADIADFIAALPATADAARIERAHRAAERLQARMLAYLHAPQAGETLRRLRQDCAQAGIGMDLLAANLAGLLFQSCEAGAALLGNALVLAGRRGLRRAPPRTRRANWSPKRCALIRRYTTPDASWPTRSTSTASASPPGRPCCWCWPPPPSRNPTHPGPLARWATPVPARTWRAAMRRARWPICCAPAPTRPPWPRAIATGRCPTPAFPV